VLDYPNPGFHQIELDLHRTFDEEGEELDQDKIKAIRNVLRAYIKRNPTVGYCQGMNFVVARLIQFMNEEEAFWTMTMIIETMLPVDFYCNMVGVLID
jgi:hypothetical protein